MRRALLVGMLLSACSGVPYPVLLVFTDIQDVTVCCNPEGEFPIVAAEFFVDPRGPSGGAIDPTTYEVQLFYTSTSELVTLSEPSGASLPLSNSTLAVLVEGCDFDEALLDIDIVLTVERTDGTLLETGWVGEITVTNSCP
ncbi:MAG: hypothetical protein AAGF92_06690 [Myxococcota bacterium]